MIRRTITACALLLSTACVGTDVGNPPDAEGRVLSTLEFEAYVPESSQATGLVTDDGSVVESAWIALEALEVRAGADCTGTGGPTRIEGPFYVDLVGRDVLPEPPILSERPATICTLILRLEPAADDAPDALVGLSAHVVGRGADGEPLTMQSATSRTLPYDGDGFAVGQSDVERFIGAFDSSRWFDGFVPGLPATDETPSAINAFFDALRQDSRIIRDEDDDGRASPAERASPVASPL